MSGQVDVQTDKGWMSAEWLVDQEMVRVEWPGTRGVVYLTAAEAVEIAAALREVSGG